MSKIEKISDRSISLKWTDRKPTEPGWYWTQLDTFGPGSQFTQIVHVDLLRTGELTEINRPGKWRWAGPIREPEEPQDVFS